MSAPTELVLSGPHPLRGRLRVPGDKGISHRALLFAALADGRSRVAGLAGGDDVSPHPRRRSAAGGARAASRPPTATVAGHGGRRAAPSRRASSTAATPARPSACWRASSPGRPFLTVLDRRRVAVAAADGPGRRAAARRWVRVDGRADGTLPPLIVARRRPASASTPPSTVASAPGEDRARSSPGCRPTAPPRSPSRRRAATTPSGCSPRSARRSSGSTSAAVRVTAGAPRPLRARRARRPVVGRVLGRRGHDHARVRARGRGRRAEPGAHRLRRRAACAWARRSRS